MPPESEYSLNAEFIAEATAGRIVQGHGIDAPNGVVIDSRRVRPGCLFVPLKGSNRDGHAFVRDALEQGAAGVLIVRDRIDEFKPLVRPYAHRAFVVAVTDTLTALQDMAAAWLNLLGTTVVGVTGSVGKTSTKGLIAAGLSAFGAVAATPGNYNNAIGLPLSVLGTRPSDLWAVLEYGTSAPGEIQFLAGIAQPKVAVVTGVSGSHLESFNDLDGVAAAKSELVRALPKNGTAVLNADDPRVMGMAGLAGRVVTFGRSESADVRVMAAKVTDDMKTACTLRVAGNVIDVKLGVLGLQHAMNLAAATAVALALGVDVRDFVHASAKFRGEAHRMEVLRTSGGVVIDDSYNASEASIQAALDTLSQVDRPLVVVLGDVLEAGPDSGDLHRRIGRSVAHSRASLFVTMGEQMGLAADAAAGEGMDRKAIIRAKDHKQAVELVQTLGGNQPIVLIKGSRGMRMELIAQTLTAIWNKNAMTPDLEMEQ